jgi:hypothetical protein
MSEPSIEQFGGVLAAPLRRPWRAMVANFSGVTRLWRVG